MGAKITELDRDAKPLDLVATLRSESAVIVRELLDPGTVDRVVAGLAPHLEAVEEPGGGDFYGGRVKSCGNLFSRGRVFSDELLLNQRLLEVADGVLLPQCPMGVSEEREAEAIAQHQYELEEFFSHTQEPGSDPLRGPNCHHYRVHATAAIQIWGGGRLQPLHREMDGFYPFFGHDPAQPVCVLGVMWALTDFTLENGATRIVPGSHLWEQTRLAKEGEVAQGVMPRGSALFWLGRTLHSLAINHTDTPRTGIFMSLSSNWLTQEENQFLAVPPELARTLPEKAQRLLGYRGAGVGWVGGLDSENLLNRGGRDHI